MRPMMLFIGVGIPLLIPSENIASINFVLYICQAVVEAVSNYGFALRLERGEVINHPTAKECSAIIERRLVNDYLRAFGFYALHDALNCRLAEIVRVGFHRQTIDAYHATLWVFGILVIA